jgi:lipopolysaccharide/colanic/teichoic acid biosynthesis glycosyltransferase
MTARLFDIVLAGFAIIVLSPLLLIAALGIRLSSSGPVLYRAQRVGKNGKLFTMYKFRSMHVETGGFQSRITSADDPRVFRFGAWLRFLKLDELPQLFNIIKGEMSIVGPRAEDPQIVEKHYRPEHYETLRMPPGLASPGSIFNYTHGERMLQGADAESIYATRLLPIKLALDRTYVQHASVAYNIRIIFRTSWVIVLKTIGKQEFSDPPEMNAAVRLLSLDKS